MPSAHTTSRLFVISDIHGHAEGLKLLLQLADYAPEKDRLILLGDYIDKEPATWDTLYMVRELARQGAVALPGNMETELVRLASSSSVGLPPELLDWVRSMPLYRLEDGFLFVHAGIRRGLPLESQSATDLTEIREDFWRYEPEEDYTVVFGHTPTFKLGAAPGSIWLASGRIGIDCGAKHGMRLALLDLSGASSYSCSTASDNLYGDLRIEHFR